jgi:pyruvate formate lyase activating enzyme
MVVKGTVFDLRRYSIHDGPGIRTTVFLKGCPMSCWWCHNPEGQSPGRELMLRQSRCREGCADCVPACSRKAISKSSKASVDRARCKPCPDCEAACNSQALEVVGRSVTVEQVLDEVEKDRAFYERSGGGVTLSGGEPLAQPEFAVALAEGARRRGIHVAVDTTGHAPAKVAERVAASADLFLYDLKLMDDAEHVRYTGVTNALAISNIRRLGAAKVEVRVPVIPGVTDGENNLRAMAALAAGIEGVTGVALLPYHASARAKYTGLGREYRMGDVASPTDAAMGKARKVFEDAGLATKVGG